MKILYRTLLKKDINIFGTVDTDDISDFEDNYKSSAIAITGVDEYQFDAVADRSYIDFKALISNWATVCYINTNKSYEIFYSE